MRPVVVLLAASVAGFLTGCAGSPTGLSGLSPDEVASKVLAPAAVQQWSDELAEDLRDSLGEGTVTGRVHVRGNGSIILSLDPADTFEARSAQLKAGALEPCSGISGAYQRHPGSVLHVLVLDSIDADLEPAARLAARRAASLQQLFELTGTPRSRLRAEGQVAGGDDRAELVLTFAPVVEGQESQAWAPPSPEQ